MRLFSVLAVLAAAASGAAAQPAQPARPQPWRIGEPEVVWSYDPQEDSGHSAHPERGILSELALHPDGGFVAVIWAANDNFSISRFDRDWRRVWRTVLPSSRGQRDTRHRRHVHIEFLPDGALVLRVAQALALLEADGNLRRWISPGTFGFEAVGSVTAYGGALLIGGTGLCTRDQEPRTRVLCATMAVVDRDGILQSYMGFAVMREGGGDDNVPAAALPLAVRESGRIAAIAGCSLFEAQIDIAEDLIFWYRWRGDTWPCRNVSRLRLLEYDGANRLSRHRVIRDRPVSGHGGLNETLPSYALIDAPISLDTSRHVPAADLYWLDARAGEIARLAARATNDLRLRSRRRGAVAAIPVAAAASVGDTTLILLRRVADEPRADPETSASHRHILMIVSPRGVALVDDRIMPNMASVRLAPATGHGYGIAGNRIVRFPLRHPAQ